MKAMEFLMYYRKNTGAYLPMIDHQKKVFPEQDEEGDINIGWDCGAIGRRPYFGECWSVDGITMLTYFISTEGIEDYSAEQIEDLLTEGAALYRKKDGYRQAKMATMTDGEGNDFFSVNILVGLPGEDALIDGGAIYHYRELNQLNG